MLSVLRLANRILSSAILITAFSLAIYILRYNWRSAVGRAFCILLTSVMVVYLGDAAILGVTSTGSALAWLKLQWVGLAFVPAVYLHFSDALLNVTSSVSRWRHRAVWLSYMGSGLTLLLVTFTPWIVLDVVVRSPFSRLQPGSLFWAFALYFFATVVAGAVNINRARVRCLTSTSRRRMAYLTVSFAAPALGVFPYMLLTTLPASLPSTILMTILLLGNVGIALMIVVMAYAVTYFGAFNPDRVIKYSLIEYLLRGPLLASLVLVLLVTVPRVQNFIGLPGNLVTLAAAVLTIVLAQMAISMARPVLNRLVYRQDLAEITWLQELDKRLLTPSDLEQFLENVLSSLAELLRVRRAFVVTSRVVDPHQPALAANPAGPAPSPACTCGAGTGGIGDGQSRGGAEYSPGGDGPPLPVLEFHVEAYCGDKEAAQAFLREHPSSGILSDLQPVLRDVPSELDDSRDLAQLPPTRDVPRPGGDPLPDWPLSRSLTGTGEAASQGERKEPLPASPPLRGSMTAERPMERSMRDVPSPRRGSADGWVVVDGYALRPLYTQNRDALLGLLVVERGTSPVDGTSPPRRGSADVDGTSLADGTSFEDWPFVPSLSEGMLDEAWSLIEQVEVALEDRHLQQGIYVALQQIMPDIERIQKQRQVMRYVSSMPQPVNGTSLAGGTSLADGTSPGSGAIDDPSFNRWVKDALGHYWGGPKLSHSPLLGLSVVEAARAQCDGDVVRALRTVLEQAIEALRPDLDPGQPALGGSPEGKVAARPVMTAPEWTFYNIVDLKFRQGYRMRDIARRLAVSESDLYRKQRAAIAEVARLLAHMEQQALS